MRIRDSIHNMFDFNRRVLNMGRIRYGEEYTDKRMLNLITFNKIFISNVRELYEKHKGAIYYTYTCYIPILREYTKNMKSLSKIINLKRKTINIEDNFHIAYVDETNLRNLLIDLSPERIYYFARVNTRLMIFTMRDDHKDDIVNLHTDAVVKSINKKYHTTTALQFRLAKHETGRVMLLEYNGDFRPYRNLYKHITCLQNQFLWIDPIVETIKRRVVYGIKPIPKKHRILLEDLKKHEHLITYPYESFDTFIDILEQSAECDEIEEIYFTIYRIGKDRKIYNALRKAGKNGKRVNVFIELNASGETINRRWMMDMLEIPNVTVGRNMHKKVHSKICMIKFYDGTMISQIGTGNYHTETAKQYVDHSYFTTSPSVGVTIESIFRMINEQHSDFTFRNPDMLVSTDNMRHEILELIETQSNPDGYIAFQCNTLSDIRIIAALDRAANRGCVIDMIVRGDCSWWPDPKLKVRIKSVVWDRLEHARIYAFGKIEPVVLIGSADMVEAKLDGRVETLVAVNDRSIKRYLLNTLVYYMNDKYNSWDMVDGVYRKTKWLEGVKEDDIRSIEECMVKPWDRVFDKRNNPRIRYIECRYESNRGIPPP